MKTKQLLELIKENDKMFTDGDNLSDFINDYHQDGDDLDSLDDSMHEYADGCVPIYYNDIVEEWRKNSSCHGEAGEQGLIEGVTDAYKIMQVDLYAMYYDSIANDMRELQDLVEEQEEEEE